MDNNILRQFNINYKQIIIDEIALEGLDGIGLDYLWRRIGKRLSTDLTEKMKTRYWSFIVNNSSLSFYELPEPLPYIEILDRFTIIDESSGHLKEPNDYLDGPYHYNNIEKDHGSCKFYDNRTPIPTLVGMSHLEAESKYGNKLVIVASIEERWHALAPHMPITHLAQMMSVNYCLLELIGRSRENGQMSVGKSNLHKIIKDSKTLFYNRKYLQDLDLIYLQNLTQVVSGKGIKCLLIRLKRFHKPGVLTMPKIGVLHNVISYLLKAPGYCERTELLVKEGLLSQKQNRRLQKTVNIFHFEDRSKTVESSSKNKKAKITHRRKYICLSSKSDESSDSDEEVNDTSVGCQYKVGISLMRQAYEQFLDAGLQGLTQVQLSHLLGIEFYTSRSICRIFRLRNIVREYLEDNGKQRTARFIAVVATEKMDKKYEEQKNTFLQYLVETKSSESTKRDSEQVPSSDEDIPLKKIKLEKQSDSYIDGDDLELPTGNEITEIKVIDGFEKSKGLSSFKKNPTLRQLKFANGILKVLQEKLCVTGYGTLSTLASKAVNEPPMDSKALKSFIQKLINDGHIKMYKIKWPGLQKYSIIICAHHIKITDAVIKAKYKEVCMKAAVSQEINAKKEAIENNPAPAKVKRTYPRFMKIQKLHEFVMSLTYFDYVKPETHSLPHGFICAIDLFHEANIELLINNLCTSTTIEMYQLVTENQLQLKLKEAPPNVYKILMRSKVIQNAIRLNLKVLAMLGLIQLVSHHTAVTDTETSNYSSFLFYVNRNAKILDTSGTWPRNRLDVEEKSFYFETPEDVAKYWTEVFTVSTNTEIILPERRRKYTLHSPLRSAKDVQIYDTGERFGDGLGPCGFDSCFYMEIPRLWHTFYARPLKKIIKKKRVPRFETIKKPKAKPKPKVRRVVQRVPIERPTVPLKRNKPDGSVKWSKRDDLILTLCKAAITIMSPNSQPGSLIVRNIVAKDLVSINDPRKTKGLCHSRFSTIDTNVTLVHEKQCIINEMRRRRNIVQKYEGLLKKLRLKYSTNMSKYINKARVPMLELVWILKQVMRSKSYTEKLPCVALNLEDFHNHFSITTSTANKLFNMYKISENSPLKEAIVVTVMQTIDSELDTETAKRVFTTFKQFPESALRIAVEQLRKCSAIAAKEKLFNNQIKIDLEDIVQTSYKISMFYRRRWICRLNSDFTDAIASLLKTDEFDNDIKGSPEGNCASCELAACDLIEIVSSTVPVIVDSHGIPIRPEVKSAQIIDTKYSMKTGTMRWKKKNNVKISDFYNVTDFSTSIEHVTRSGIVSVKQCKKENIDRNDPIISLLKLKGEKGATFLELQDFFKISHKSLLEKLLQLESDNIIKRVGFYENVIVLSVHFKSWSTKIVDNYVLCTPWLTLNSGIKIDIFLKWTSIIMNTVFEKPGCSVANIADRCEFITYRAVQDGCVFLEKNGCLRLNTVIRPPLDLFSNDDGEIELIDFNPFFAPEFILVFPTKNCLTKYSYIKKTIINKRTEDNCDFDEK